MGWVTADHPTIDELNACVQCGLCLPACPTFRLTGRETASPRGRIQAMKAVHNGVLELDGPFQGVIDFCLGCRACEPVCPGMVPYGRVLEGTRAEIAAQRPTFSHRLRSFLLGTAIGSRRSLRLGTGALRMAQATRATSLTPSRYRRLSEGMRPLGRRPKPTLGHKGGSGASGSIALLAGCIQDEWFRPVNHAAIAVAGDGRVSGRGPARSDLLWGPCRPRRQVRGRPVPGRPEHAGFFRLRPGGGHLRRMLRPRTGVRPLGWRWRRNREPGRRHNRGSGPCHRGRSPPLSC